MALRRARTAASALAAAAALAALPAGAGAQPCVPRTNIEAIVDDSGSMTDSDPQRLRRGGLELFIRTKANAARRLGTVEFGSTAGTVFAPGPIRSGGRAMIAALRRSILDNGAVGGTPDSTDYNQGLSRARADNPAADGRIFLTDGGHNVGAYRNLHAPGPPTYVVGLGIGTAGSSTDANRLAGIAQQTGGQYFPDVSGVRIQSVFNTISALVGCRKAPLPITLPDFSREGQQRSRDYRPGAGSKGVSLVLNWQNPSNRFRVLDAIALGPRGKRLATLRGRGGGRRLAFNRFGGSTFDSLTLGRVRGQRALLIRILARRLRGSEAPLLQAGDLRSLRGLGLRTPEQPRRRTSSGDWPARAGWTVVLTSQRGKGAAQAVARRARGRGLPGVGLLFSSRHSNLNPGYWVAFTGVLSRTQAFQRQARARAAGFSDAYARSVARPR